MSKAQAARTFSVSLSSVKRATLPRPTAENRWLRRRETRICSEAGRQNHDALGGGPQRERPFATLQERCDYVELMTGLSL